jgi:hypothetical protein
MSEARALTSTVCNIVSCVAVAKWQRALDTEKLQSELKTGFVPTESARLEVTEPALAH